MLDTQIEMGLGQMPLFRYMDYCTASLPFVHRDRIIPFHVLLYIVSGEMSIWEEGVEYHATPGTVLFLKAGAHHWGERSIPAGTAWYYIHFFQQEPEANVRDYDLGQAPQPERAGPKDYQYRIPLPKCSRVRDGQQLRALLDGMKELFFSGDTLRYARLSARLKELLLFLYDDAQPPRPVSQADRLAQELARYLKQNANRSLSSQEIAGHMHMNYRYLCGVFKEKTGMGINAFHTRQRIGEACRLFRETTLNISEISDSLGYANPFYFSSVFKKVTGKSPRAYLDSISRQPST